MKDNENFEFETKLILLNYYQHTSRGRSNSLAYTAQHEFVPLDIASRRYRSLPESVRHRSTSNSDTDTPASKLSRSDLRPEIFNLRLSLTSSEVSSSSSNMDADDEMESNPSIGSGFSQPNTTVCRNRLSTVYSECEMSPDIQSGRILPPESFPQLLFKDANIKSPDLCDDDDDEENCFSISTSPDNNEGSFQNEVQHLMEHLQSESEGNSPDSEEQSRPLSPISNAARKLEKISDEIQETYGQSMDQSICRLFSENLTYNEFCNALNYFLETSEANWIMISAVMLFSKRCALYFFNQGVNVMSRILDFTTKYLEDVASDFINDNGGWTNVSSFSEAQLSELSLENSTVPDSGNNPLPDWQSRGPIHPVNTNVGYDEIHPHISTPLEYLNPEPSEDITSPNPMDPTAVVALAAMICASYIYLTN